MLCRHCGQNEGTLRCTGCRAASYCSKECQLVSWKQGHKELCGGKTTNKHLTPIAPLVPPPVRLSPTEERAARAKNSWGLACQCLFTIDYRYVVESDDPGLYFAIPNAPMLEKVTEHISDNFPALDFPHKTSEILCEFSIASGGTRTATRYRAIVPTPPDFLAANERSCDIGPPYRASEELCNRTALGIQNSFAKQLFALPEMQHCSNARCFSAQIGVPVGPRKVVVGSKLVFRTRKPACEDIWAPCCYDEWCVDTVRTMLTNAMVKNTKR